MALHPRVQVNLYKYLSKVAKSKDLTIIFSTHSVSLLKSVPRSRIIFLQREDSGNVVPIYGCFPTYAIGAMSLDEERAPDHVFYVEDEVAKAIVDPLLKLTMQDKFADNTLFPSTRVVPLGPFEAVVRFLSQHISVMEGGTKCFALLDQDVKTEVVSNWETERAFARLAAFQRRESEIRYLPWTPEVGIVEYLIADRRGAETLLRRSFNNHQLSISASSLDGTQGLTGKHLRNACKRIFSGVCQDIARRTSCDTSRAREAVCEVFAEAYFRTSGNAVKALFGPLLD